MNSSTTPINTLQSDAKRYRLNNPQISNETLAEKLGLRWEDSPHSGMQPSIFFQGPHVVAIRTTEEELVIFIKPDYGVEKTLLSSNLGRLSGG